MTTDAATTPSTPTPALDQRAGTTQLRAQQWRAFRIHATVFAVSMVFIAFTNLAINAAAGIMGEWWAWWSVLALVGWGLGVTIHGLAVRLSGPQGSGTA